MKETDDIVGGGWLQLNHVARYQSKLPYAIFICMGMASPSPNAVIVGRIDDCPTTGLEKRLRQARFRRPRSRQPVSSRVMEHKNTSISQGANPAFEQEHTCTQLVGHTGFARILHQSLGEVSKAFGVCVLPMCANQHNTTLE
jgi:hypothetical protein